MGSEDDMTRRTRENLVSGGIALGSLVFLLWVIPTFTPPYPGYGVSSALLPSLAFGLILVLAVLSLLYNLFIHLAAQKKGLDPPGAEEITENEQVHLLHLIKFMVPCVLLMPAMRWIGFIPGGLLFMFLIQYFCGQRKPTTMIIVAVCSVGGMYAAMRYGLGVPMP